MNLTDSEHPRTASPPITAMDLHHELLAERAAELMPARLAGAPEPAQPLVIDPVLHLRAGPSRATLAVAALSGEGAR